MENITPAPAEPDAAITVAGAARHFGPIRAVDGVDLSIRRGELFGLIGHNGAGKSTLFRMMLGLLPASSGRIRIDSVEVASRGFRAVRRHIGYLPENVVLYDNLTALETLQFFARLKHADPAGCAAVLERVGLTHATHRRVREFSKGMRQRLGFAQALLGRPRILFLDEPTNGLDPEAIRDFYATLRALREEGVTVVLTSHILSEIQQRVDRLAIMAAGRIRSLGTVQALREAMELPLVIDIATAAPDAVRDTLAPLGLDTAPSAAGLSVRCPRERKMAALGALATLGAAVRDLTVHEPSLEDVFFGLAD